MAKRKGSVYDFELEIPKEGAVRVNIKQSLRIALIDLRKRAVDLNIALPVLERAARAARREMNRASEELENKYAEKRAIDDDIRVLEEAHAERLLGDSAERAVDSQTSGEATDGVELQAYEVSPLRPTVVELFSCANELNLII